MSITDTQKVLISLLTFEEKMETTPSDYSNYSYDNDSEGEFVGICDSDGANYLGAQISFIYYFMFLFSLVGNGLVLVIIHRFERLTTVTNILLLNLVMSSLIFMSSLPFHGVYMQLSNWIFGNVMCKIVGSVYFLGLYSSVLFLALLTFDRHLAVVYSLGAPRMRSHRYAFLSCAVVWLVSSLACIPSMILYRSFHYALDDTTLCQEYPGNLMSTYAIHLRNSAFYIQLCVFLLFPLIVIVYCYVRIAITVISSKIVSKFKTVRLIFVIVLLFFISWIPYNVVLLTDNGGKTCEEIQRRGYADQVTRNLAYIYFCISPIFYTFVGKKFQNYFRQMMVKRFPGLKKYISVDQVRRSNMSTKSTPY
ncbi:C-C chemokine receptor type 3-like [Scomber japonicus]|uniref:C-C chemokine receptor type 3-like n=1 Tax=Scomber japonicus TaxID=13676 RepID=UPI002305A762|nr:C-C chemokine receptor type 3-like [Scomber japonicus]